MIGILDSGLGGLSVYREIRRLMPEAPITYVADSKWCPYGDKSYDQIYTRVAQIVDFLIDKGASVIVIACNSATIACVESLRAVYPIPIVGMEPGVKPAVSRTRSGVVGVLATEASLAGEKFHKLVAAHSEGVRVITQPCPKFVTLVEKGITDGTEVDQAISEYTDRLITEGADTLVLGCTHYPFLSSALSGVLGSEMQMIDTGKAVAEEVSRRYEQVEGISQQYLCFSSGDIEIANKVSNKLLALSKSNRISFQVLEV